MVTSEKNRKYWVRFCTHKNTKRLKPPRKGPRWWKGQCWDGKGLGIRKFRHP